MSDPSPSGRELPLAGEGLGDASISERIASLVMTRRTPASLLAAAAAGLGLVLLLFASIAVLLVEGVGIWGIGVPVGWGFAIVNLVWWIGIGHAGTLISAVLLLLHQRWRTSINRFAEAMTLFAIACAGLFPLLHMGRPWLFYWLLPYPNTMGVWPQFRSPLVWDAFAIGTYGLVSALFWYVGLVPDLASVRDRTSARWKRIVFGFLAMGWRGSARHWHRYEKTYFYLAALATPLVVSVHSVVSLDFAVSIVPGWHTTIFPPYFVAGALFSGFAMVLTLLVPLREMFDLHDFVTDLHLDRMAKVLLATGLIVGYGYAMEVFAALYSAEIYEEFLVAHRALGPAAWAWWTLLACNVGAPQVLWSRRVRRSPLALFGVAMIVNLGMWLERFVIVVTSLERGYLPASWGDYAPTLWDWALLFGSIGLFVTLLVGFVRALPIVSMAEMKSLVREGTRSPGARDEEGAR